MSTRERSDSNPHGRLLTLTRGGSLESVKRVQTREKGSSISHQSRVDKQIKHTFDELEVVAFAEHLSTLVKGDPDLEESLPYTKDNLFDAISHGVLLWYPVVICLLISKQSTERYETRKYR